MGSLASFGLYLLSDATGRRVAAIEFQNRSKEHLAGINTDMRDAFSLLGTLQVFFESSTGPADRGEFGRFSATLHARAAGLRDAGWAPHIAAADRDPFERAVQASGYPGFEIRERTPDGGLARAGARPDYYPILYQDPPLGPAHTIMGLDLMSGPDRGAALRRAIAMNAPAATAPLRLVSMDHRLGIYCYLPVRRAAAAGAEAKPLAGIVFGTFDLAPMLAHIVAEKRSLIGLDLYVFNPAGGVGDRLIYWRPGEGSLRHAPDEALVRRLPHFEGSIGAMNHDLGALFMPAPTAAGALVRFHEIGPSIACLILTAITVAYLRFSLRSRLQLESVTESLRQTTARLLDEQERIAHMAEHDALTGLPNRRHFGDALHGVIARTVQAGGACAVLLIDLDRFKPINDLHGHGVGDMVLCAVAERLQAIIRKNTTVARLGGDEFAVIIDGLGPDFEQAGATVALRLISSLSAPIVIPQATLEIGATIGIAFCPADGDAPEQVLHAADLAMYSAKRRERGTLARFDAGMGLVPSAQQCSEDGARQTKQAVLF